MSERGFTIAFDVVVERPLEDVFSFLADTTHFRDVDEALVDFGPEGPLVLGRTGWFRHRRGGMTARTTWTVTEYEAPTRLTVEIAGMGYGMTEAAMLERTESGTRARFVERVWPTSLPGRLLVALSGGIMRRDLAKRSDRLAAALKAVGSRDARGSA